MHETAGAWRRRETQRAHSHALSFFLPFFLALSGGAAALIYGVGNLVIMTLRPFVAVF